MANKQRLIDANALTDAIECTDWYHVSLQGNLVHGARSDIHTPLYKADDIYKALTEAPTVDAVPVVHGRWIPREDNGSPMHECSECGARIPKGLYEYENPNRFCYHCGARMDGGEHESRPD